MRYRAVTTSHARNVVQRSPCWLLWFFVSAHPGENDAIYEAGRLTEAYKLRSREYVMSVDWPWEGGW